MIDLFFQYLNEFVLIRIDGKNLLFGNTTYKNQLATFDGLKLNRQGTIREFPDLATNIHWETIARERFKQKINSMQSEEEIEKYLIEDLRKFGYIPKLKQKKGFRIQKIQ